VSLQAMALAAKEKHGGTDFVCILDARMEEVYWAQYRYADNRLQQVSAPELSRIDDVSVSKLAKDTVIVVGEGVNLTDALHQFFHAECMPHAAYVARLGLLAHEAGLCVAPEDAQPLYLRNKIALTTAERMQAKAIT
ncbi:MAG: tRNA (adenosine(37)-N6)-threonylcarbamoyltransferase complex dimerization subunit type 1 TsaB, partial [Burkholderiales bacterium]|nr:tRNA (adenosine(37)-N6)-threonylcarbamoyltransferase complex dimerization subunit type 1 TsaB [Burkholderiales bacterium]